MTRFIIIRHGESKGNAERAFLGHSDWDMTPKGYLQAQKTADFLNGVNIDAVYSSDLIRAYNTAKPVADRRGLNITTTQELREIFAGLWEGMKFDDIAEVYPKSHKTWMEDVGNAVCDGGESVAHLQERVKAELERIARENNGKTVCVATHATPIRTMLCVWNGLPVEEAKNFKWITNASVTIVDYNDDGSYTIECQGEAEHLESIASEELKNI